MFFFLFFFSNKIESSSSKGSSGYTPSPHDQQQNRIEETATQGGGAGFKKRTRDSMYLATPVVNSSKMSGGASNYLTSPSQRDLLRRDPSPSRMNGGGWSAHVSASPYNSDNQNTIDSTFDNSDDFGYERERKRTQSVGNRLHKKPPLPVVVKVRAKEFHSSADLLRNGSSAAMRADDDAPPYYVCGDFESNGMYSATPGNSKLNNVEYGSTPYLPQSYSSPGIAGIATGRLQRHSPNTAKRLEQLSLTSSPSSRGSSRDHLDYLPPPPSYAQHSMESGSEQSEDMWADMHSEETLV